MSFVEIYRNISLRTFWTDSVVNIAAKNQKAGRIALSFWRNIKKRPEIQTFLKGMNIKVNLLEDGYSPKERVLEMEN